MTGQAKIELLLELKNKMKTGLSKAKAQLQRGVGQMKKSLNSLKVANAKAFSSLREEVPALDKALKVMGNPYAIMTAGLVGLALLTGKVASAAAKFDTAFLPIQQLNLDKSKAQMSSYKSTIMDTAFSAGTALDATTQAFYDIQSGTGLFGKDVANITKKIGEFSIATGAELPDATNQTIKAMKAFGMGVEDIDGLLASNAKTVQVGITTFKELAQVQTEYTGAAAGAGQTIDTANKLFAAFTSIAKDSATAATMTKSAFEGLTQKNTIKGLKSIGVSLYDDTGKMRDLGNVMKEVSAKFKKMTPKEIDTLINSIGGPEGLKNMFVKLKTGSEDFFKTLEAYDNSKFDMSKALANAKGDFNTLKDIVGNKFNVIMAKLGEKILPSLGRALEKVSKLFDWAYENIELIKSLATVVGVAIIAFAGLSAILWVLSANPIALIAGAVIGLIAGMVILVQKFDAVREWFSGISVWVKVLMAVFGSFLTPLFLLAGAIRFIIDNFNNLKIIAMSVFSVMTRFYIQLHENIVFGIKMLFLKFKEFGQNVLAVFEKIEKAKSLMLSGKFSEAKDAITAKIKVSATAEIEQLDRDKRNSDFTRNWKQNRDLTKLKTAASQLGWKKEGPQIEAEGVTDLKNIKKTTNSDINPDPTNTSTSPDANATSTDTGIGSVTGSAKQVKNITVNIDALNKGGINTKNTEMQHMDGNEMEEWFSAMMMRLIRKTELS